MLVHVTPRKNYASVNRNIEETFYDMNVIGSPVRLVI